MKILAASDLHGNQIAYEWLAQTARDRRVKLVVLAGDLLGCPEGYQTVEAGQRHDAQTVIHILEAIQTPILYIMGNDDFVDLNPASDQFTSLHGRRIEVGGFNLVGYQYSLPFMGGVYEKREEAIRDDLVQLRSSIDTETVLVTHSPAYGVLDTGIQDIHAGSRSIQDVVRDCDVRAHIHGHIHGCFGRSGRHFNVAAGGQCRAMVINLETLEATTEKLKSIVRKEEESPPC
jgi:Icc-related predicted phosphoesterase